MTSTQSRRVREGVDVPSQIAAIDAVKVQPEIASDRRRRQDRQQRRTGTHGRGHIPRSNGPRGPTESPMPGSRDRDVVDAHHSASGHPVSWRRDRNPRQVWLISPPGAGCVRMSLLSVAGLPAWPLSTGCEAWTWT